MSEVVRSFINDIVNPLLGLALGSVEGLNEASFSFFGADILWGSFAVVLINFVIIAAVVYYGFKGLGLDAFDAKKQH